MKSIVRPIVSAVAFLALSTSAVAATKPGTGAFHCVDKKSREVTAATSATTCKTPNHWVKVGQAAPKKPRAVASAKHPNKHRVARSEGAPENATPSNSTPGAAKRH